MHRARPIVALIALSIFGGSAVEPAMAAPPLRLPRIKPRVTIPRIPRPPVAIPEGFSTGVKWGIDDPAAILSLDAAETAITADVDETASRVAADAESKARIKECAGDGLKGAGESYRDRVQEASDAGALIPQPNFDEVGAGIADCMEGYFPDVPVGAVFHLAQELAEHQAESARQAAAASQSAAVLARWMTVSGETIAADADTADQTISADPEPDPDDQSPPWGLIVVGIIVVALIAAVYRGSRSSRT